MATAVPEKNAAPFAARLTETYLDSVTGANSDRSQNVRITFDLTGTVSQIQADWATLIAATMTATTARVTHSAA
jgi:hypothetical protein